VCVCVFVCMCAWRSVDKCAEMCGSVCMHVWTECVYVCDCVRMGVFVCVCVCILCVSGV